MTALVAFYDANVLYPSTLRNLLMHMALRGLFRAKWSAQVHEEWITTLLRNRPDLTRAQLEHTRDLMDKHAVDALVTGYEDLIPRLKLPDPNDGHVLAAAIRAQANVIVTMNLRDFPRSALAAFGIRAQHPDSFVMHLLKLAPDLVSGAAHDHRVSLKRPVRTVEEYLDDLSRCGLLRTATALPWCIR